MIAYCDDIIILSPSYGQAMILLEECFTSKVLSQEKFVINGVQLLNVDGFEYLGLPIGSCLFISEFIEEKWKKVERIFYSLYGLGCKPKFSNPYLIGFLFKQYCQSISKHVLDNILIPSSLNELDTRQNLLLKRIFGLKKFTHISPLYEAFKIESLALVDEKKYEYKNGYKSTNGKITWRCNNTEFPNWNCHDRTLQGLQRTNNNLEGWHHGLHSNIKSHPHLLCLIDSLKLEQSNTENLYVQLSTGLNYLATIEWFNKIVPNDKSKFYHDKTILCHEFSTPFKLICIKKCLSLNSSCQYFQHTTQGICSFFDQDQLNNLFTNNRIYIIQSGLRLIVPFAFEKCNQVQVLNISNNNLKQYSKSFYGMFKLKVLLIDSNNMSNLESDVFQDVPLLNNLNLKDNLIKNLDDNLFDYSRELVSIHLGSNQIEWLHKGIFKNLRKLKYLFINDNRLKFLEHLFDNLELLEFLDVSYNQIDTIQNDTFKNLKQIKKNHIFQNKLSEINSETLKGANNLNSLLISWILYKCNVNRHRHRQPSTY
ncbi:unnamed protein product [Brachionus calyciflorus]|uniref:Uncharacterized protein n=1 Tax=Brachionus calyciflorus TaxID=104777 RepID=A0A813YAQ1_9BILA|nr:unnamed protein product [Brachionus calyciflorus]